MRSAVQHPSQRKCFAPTGVGEDLHPHDREIRVLRIAKIHTQKGEGLGIVRNVSSTGMVIEIHPGQPLGKHIEVDLGTGRTFSGEVRWLDRSTIGIRFAEPVDVSRILDRSALDLNNKAARLPRLAVTHPVELTIANEVVHAEVCDISTSGAKLATRAAVQQGDQLAVTFPVVGTIQASVRWSNNGICGISFNKALSIHALMAWLQFASGDRFAQATQLHAQQDDVTSIQFDVTGPANSEEGHWRPAHFGAP